VPSVCAVRGKAAEVGDTDVEDEPAGVTLELGKAVSSVEDR
jgi:hypothetical protein